MWSYCFPYDSVGCEFRGIPPGCRFLCLVGETATGRRLMPWDASKIGHGRTHPDDCTWSADPGPRLFADVRWIESARVGVLLEAENGSWSIFWFGEDSSTPDGRLPLLGGGSWRRDLREAVSEEPLTEAEVRALGLDQAPEDRDEPEGPR